ncbi:uncharacterized protein LOC109432654 isoform X1 [Aedes albopictus]|uniref:Uncharacterized protein n=1 Tax=Aedes albopictus TaxID=7160 RepID=A0ABM1YX78_AEDAL
MTLRENSAGGHEIPPNRKYSVSHSGRFKSRPKIRPSLSGDVFRPEPQVNTAGVTRPEETQQKAQPTVQRTTTIEQVDVDSENPRAQQMHQAHPHHHASHSQKHHSTREILETSL